MRVRLRIDLLVTDVNEIEKLFFVAGRQFIFKFEFTMKSKFRHLSVNSLTATVHVYI